MNNSRLERTVSNSSLNSSLRRPHNDTTRMIREKEPIVPKNPVDLSLKGEQSKDEQVYNEKAVVDDQEISELLDSMSVVPPKSEPKGWRTLIGCPTDFFEVSVQYINEAENTIFVMESKYEEHAVKLLRSINRQINAQCPPLSPEDIREGGLYAAPFEDVYYRAEVMSVWKEKQAVVIRLVDYGNQFECKYSDLKASIPIMKNLNAYGINIRPKTKQKIQLDDVILIKIADKPDSSRIFPAEIQPVKPKKEKNVVHEPVSPLQMILERRLLDCFVSYIFHEKNAVLATFTDNKVGENLKTMNKVLENGDDFLSEVVVGEFYFVIGSSCLWS